MIDSCKNLFYNASNYLHAWRFRIIQDTRKKIIDATLSLVKKHGYKGTTTRAIAEEAGVNEVTIFRHFKNKKGILQEAFQNTSYVPRVLTALRNEIQGDLESDLLMIARLYQQLLAENSDLILISIKEADYFPELKKEVVNVPIQIKMGLVQYFEKMRSENKLVDTNLEAQALLFIWLNFSYFTARFDQKSAITELSVEEYLTNTITTFARGLTP